MTQKITRLSGAKAFFKKAGEKSLEVSGKFGNQRHMSILRDAFAVITPLMIAGALAVLLRTFVFAGGGSNPSLSIIGWIAKAAGDIHVNGTGDWAFSGAHAFAYANASHIGNFWLFGVSHATIDSMSIYVAFAIGFFLASSKGSNSPLMAGIASLAAFMTATLGKYMDAQGLITAIVISFVATEIYVRLENSPKLMIKMPAGVPPAVARSFAKLFPMMIALALVVTLNLPFILFGVLTNTVPPTNLWGDSGTWTIGDAFFLGIQAPFLSFVGSNSGGLGMFMVYVFMVHFLWFFGLHGSNILMGIFSPILLALYAQNATGGAHHIFVQGVQDAFIMLGGTGATFGLLIAIFIFSKNKGEKEIAKLAVGPAIFQINEPVLFGIPMVLNAKYALPFIFIGPILVLTTYFGFTWFNITPVKVLIPWTTPVGIGGLLATAMDWKGLVLALLNFIIAFAVWLPWVILWTRRGIKTGEIKTDGRKTNFVKFSKKAKAKGGE